MYDEGGDGWGEIEWLPEDPPTATDPSRVDALPATFLADKLPTTLIRILDRRVCAWSHGMESRYGFPASRAIGLTPHQFLRTISCQTLDEINRELLDQQTWSGGLVNHRSDGRPIMTASSWPPPAIGAAEKVRRDALDFHAREH